MSTARLADGFVIRTKLIARLLGVRLLRVEGTVTVTPYAAVRQPTPKAATRHAAGQALGRKMEPSMVHMGLGNGLDQARQLLRDTEGDLRLLSTGQTPAGEH